jgi:hypothetical protein
MKSNPLKFFNDNFDKRKAALTKAQPGVAVSNPYATAIQAGQKEGYVIDQAGAYKAGHDTTANTMLRSPDKAYFAQVKKPVVKPATPNVNQYYSKTYSQKKGGQIKSKK